MLMKQFTSSQPYINPPTLQPYRFSRHVFPTLSHNTNLNLHTHFHQSWSAMAPARIQHFDIDDQSWRKVSYSFQFLLDSNFNFRSCHFRFHCCCTRFFHPNQVPRNSNLLLPVRNTSYHHRGFHC